MSNSEFLPPVTEEEIISKLEGPEGLISSISLLIRDANGKLFSLHVATQENLFSSAAELGNSFESDFSEPVFVVPPSMTIDQHLIDLILFGTKPELLGRYLVHQQESS